MSSLPLHDPQVAAFIERWGEPFARALAEFVRAATETETPVETRLSTGQRGRKSAGFLPVPRSQDPRAYAHADRLAAEHRSRRHPTVRFDPTVPPRRAGIRLKEIFNERGIKQTAIARKLGVAPSVISRVLSKPERSRLETIQKIAKAAGIPLSEIV